MLTTNLKFKTLIYSLNRRYYVVGFQLARYSDDSFRIQSMMNLYKVAAICMHTIVHITCICADHRLKYQFPLTVKTTRQVMEYPSTPMVS